MTIARNTLKASSAASQILSIVDTFTEISDTALSDHISDNGRLWSFSNPAAVVRVYGGLGYVNAISGSTVAYQDIGSETIDMTANLLANSNYMFRINLKYNPNEPNNWMVIDGHVLSNTLIVYFQDIVNYPSFQTITINSAGVSPVANTVRAYIKANIFKVWLNGVLKVDISNFLGISATSAGIWFNAVFSVNDRNTRATSIYAEGV